MANLHLSSTHRRSKWRDVIETLESLHSYKRALDERNRRDRRRALLLALLLLFMLLLSLAVCLRR